MDFEVVLENVAEASLAARYGAKRIELCGALEVGGITPSVAVIEACSNIACELHVMIRPRPGDFVYTEWEIAVMKRDIELAASFGATGVVFGLLNAFGDVDAESTRSLAQKAKQLGLQVTFHRAIDFVPDMVAGIETLIGLGIDRILTSGGKANVDQGWQDVATLHDHFRGRIQVMAGGGVNLENATRLKGRIDALHFNVRKPRSTSGLSMGVSYDLDEDKIAAISKLLQT